MIEFRQKAALNELYDFLCSKNVSCEKPKSLVKNQLKSAIIKIIKQWNEEHAEEEGLKVVRKLKELTK